MRHANSDLSDLPHHPARPNAISLVPTQLMRALRSSATSERLARYDLVLVGGAALPADVAAHSSDAGINVFQSYGMSETCGGCVIDGLALPRPGRHRPNRTGVDRRPGGLSGYRGDPQETAAALVEGRL